jgi:hypothetical protein
MFRLGQKPANRSFLLENLAFQWIQLIWIIPQGAGTGALCGLRGGIQNDNYGRRVSSQPKTGYNQRRRR